MRESKKTAPELSTPKWDSVFLVCKQCRKRKNGPEKLKSKALAATVREHAHEHRPRPRVLFTSCLGVCPKGATAVAYVGGQAGSAAVPRVVSVASCQQLSAAMPLLMHREK